MKQRRRYAKLATFDDNKQLKTFTDRLDVTTKLAQINPLRYILLSWGLNEITSICGASTHDALMTLS